MVEETPDMKEEPQSDAARNGEEEYDADSGTPVPNHQGGRKRVSIAVPEDTEHTAPTTRPVSRPSGLLLAGRRESMRVGRPDHLKSLVIRRQLHQEDEKAEDPFISTRLEAEDEALEMVTDEEREEQRKAMRRWSQIQLEHCTANKTLVQVNLRNFSYYVPVDVQAPTKRTVWNQSLCYLTYQFFERVGMLCGIKKKSSARNQWSAQTASDLFLPFSKKPILNKINLCFQPGQTYLILGPPGAGKTSLLKAIAGLLSSHYENEQDGDGHNNKTKYKGKSFYTGCMEYNGIPAKDLVLANVVSFVGQLDVHAPYLTVQETFDFARKCRGGSDENNNDGENLTIKGLGLAHVADTFVGDSNVRGVSGGQRRRVTVGEMMQGFAPVACTDEISTGLDAAVTYDIVKSIVDFSKAAKTTRIVSLLQPGPETFVLFDQVILLSAGYVVYAGAVEDCVDYFASLGYPLPAQVDVADFLQLVTTPDGAALFDAETSPQDSHYTPEEFAKAFQDSAFADAIEVLLTNKSKYDWTETEENDEEKGSSSRFRRRSVLNSVPEEFRKEYQNSLWESCKLNFRRHLTLWYRDKGFIIGKAFENIGMAVATGFILFRKAEIPKGMPTSGPLTAEIVDDLEKIEYTVYAAFFMTVLHITLGTTTSAPDEIDGRPIHYKHANARFYQAPAFLFGRMLSTLPQRAIEMMAFGVPTYFLVGLDRTAKSFFIYFGIILAYTFGLKMMYSIIAHLLPNKQNILSLGTFCVLVLSLFSGFIVFPSAIPGYYYNWIYFANPMAWAFRGLVVSEFTSGKYDNLKYDTLVSGPNIGTVFLHSKGFFTDRAWMGYTFAFLIPFQIVMALIFGIVLKYVRIEPTQTDVDEEKPAVDNDAVDKAASDFNLPFTPVDLTFEDVCYFVKPSTGGDMLQLLNNVSGAFRSGRMCALMGSSGAGKTTLMDVISLRKESGEISGQIYMNGFPQERTSFLRSSGYVEQFDVQQAELTVRETVLFSARLRLDSTKPQVATDEGKRQFTDYVLETMELTDIQDLQVGSYQYGGLTFEQRKRLAIAVELAASPSVIFLDEPTSGLESRGALVIMRAMKKIADTGRTVCATIHQPSSAVFDMFDDLLLLKRGGEVVFFGELGDESCHLVDYFEGHGSKPIEYGENPAAWMLRAYTGEEHEEFDWKKAFEESEQYTTMKSFLDYVKESPDESKKITYDSIYAAQFGTRNHHMNNRIFKIMMRAPSYNLVRLMLAMVYAFLLGSVFITYDSTKPFKENEVVGIFGTIFQGLITIGVVSITMAVPVMKEIRDVFYKHRASGMLTHDSVAIAITLAELPYIVLMSVIFAVVYYASVHLFDTAEAFSAFFGYTALNIGVYVYFGQTFICLVKDEATAAALVGALIGFNVFFSGFVVRPQYITGIMAGGFWMSPGRYAFEGMIISQFIGLNYEVIAVRGGQFFYSLGCTLEDEGDCTAPMDDFVDFYFGGKFTRSHTGLCIGVLFFCLFLARFLCWFALRYFNYVNT